jgi:hypothetical protein
MRPIERRRVLGPPQRGISGKNTEKPPSPIPCENMSPAPSRKSDSRRGTFEFDAPKWCDFSAPKYKRQQLNFSWVVQDATKQYTVSISDKSEKSTSNMTPGHFEAESDTRSHIDSSIISIGSNDNSFRLYKSPGSITEQDDNWFDVEHPEHEQEFSFSPHFTKTDQREFSIGSPWGKGYDHQTHLFDESFGLDQSLNEFTTPSKSCIQDILGISGKNLVNGSSGSSLSFISPISSMKKEKSNTKVSSSESSLSLSWIQDTSDPFNIDTDLNTDTIKLDSTGSRLCQKPRRNPLRNIPSTLHEPETALAQDLGIPSRPVPLINNKRTLPSKTTGSTRPLNIPTIDNVGNKKKSKPVKVEDLKELLAEFNAKVRPNHPRRPAIK